MPDPRDEGGPDLIERLRHNAGWRNTNHHCLTSPGVLTEAADELTSLRTQVSELTADLEVACGALDRLTRCGFQAIERQARATLNTIRKDG